MAQKHVQDQTLKVKVALITGSGRGIGRSIALEYAERGADIIVNYAHSKEPAQKLVAEIKALGRDAYLIKADIAKVSEVTALVSTAYKRAGGIDILVNNAGVEKQSDFWNVSEKDFDDVINVDLKAVFFMTQAVVKRWLKDSVKGKVINISSVHEQMPFPGYASYCAAKGGVGLLTKTLAVELGPYGITVNGIAPGAIETEINASLEKDPKRMKALTNQIPLRRMGQAGDVAKVAAFLASSDSDYVTASTYYVDGGLMWNYKE